MRSLAILAAACLSALPLAACDTLPAGGIPTSPSAVCSKTIVDEQAAVGAEVAYKTFRLAAELGVNTGAIKGATATKVAELDNRLYLYLQTAEHAYETCNSADLGAALVSFNSTLSAANAAIGK